MPASESRPAPTREWGLHLALVTLALLMVVHLTVVQVNGAFALAPLIASSTVSVRRTVQVALLATFAALTVHLVDGHDDDMGWAVRSVLCVLISAVAVLNAVARVRREEQLVKMTAIAEVAQRAVLRALPASLGAVGLAARHVSATQDALIGGDLYEALPTPYGVRIIVGDVRGKGLDAVQLAATVLGAFRQAAGTQPDLPAAVAAVDAVVGGVVGDEDFVTAILLEVDDERVDLACCGHHPPLLVGPDGSARLVDTGAHTTPLGLQPRPTVTSLSWAVGSRMLVYTDGLVEARDAEGRFFRLEDHTDTLSGRPLPDALDALTARLLAHTGRRLRDDMALLLLERRPVTVPV